MFVEIKTDEGEASMILPLSSIKRIIRANQNTEPWFIQFEIDGELEIIFPEESYEAFKEKIKKVLL